MKYLIYLSMILMNIFVLQGQDVEDNEISKTQIITTVYEGEIYEFEQVDSTTGAGNYITDVTDSEVGETLIITSEYEGEIYEFEQVDPTTGAGNYITDVTDFDILENLSVLSMIEASESVVPQTDL